MSRGFGKVERAILQHLLKNSRRYFTYLWTLTRDVCGYDINTDQCEIKRADYNKVSRACISLEKKGFIKSAKITKIQHPKPNYKSTKKPPPKHVKNWQRKIVWFEPKACNWPSRYFL